MKFDHPPRSRNLCLKRMSRISRPQFRRAGTNVMRSPAHTPIGHSVAFQDRHLSHLCGCREWDIPMRIIHGFVECTSERENDGNYQVIKSRVLPQTFPLGLRERTVSEARRNGMNLVEHCAIHFGGPARGRLKFVPSQPPFQCASRAVFPVQISPRGAGPKMRPSALPSP